MRMKISIFSILAIVLLLIPVEALTADRAQATASFSQPRHCIETQNLAKGLGVVQACVQRLSPTHEFTVILNEYRLRRSRKVVVSSTEIAAMAVGAHIERLREANESQPGTTLGIFEISESLQPEEYGADHCSTVQSIAVDRRVPGYEGEEFRI